MRLLSLILLIPLTAAAGYLLFHEPQQRDFLGNVAAINVEAAISAETGWLIVTVVVIAVRSLLFLLVGIPLNLFRRRWRRAVTLLLMITAKLLLSWLIYLLLFLYGREIGFTRILWNLQDLGLQVDVSAVLAIGLFNALCILVAPDLLLGLLTGRHEAGLALRRRKVKRMPPHEESNAPPNRVSTESHGQ